MKEHAIPQDITGYKFHIVGNMTLKQFAEVALGVVVAFFIYQTNLYAPIKFILITLSALFGAALAFLPIEERPLDHWFVTFFTILYKPTKFYWKKKSKIPDAFTYEVNKNVKNQNEAIDLSPQRRQRISEYLQSVKTAQVSDQEEMYSQEKSAQILSLFEDYKVTVNSDKIQKTKQKPNLKVQVRSLIATDNLIESNPIEDISEQDTISSNLPKTEDSSDDQVKKYKFIKKEEIETDQLATDIKIPELTAVEIAEIYKKEQEALDKNIYLKNQKTQKENETTTFINNSQQMTDSSYESISATINKDLPFPTKPSKPNKLVGMTLTQSDELINNATITLTDSKNTPVTAVRSNALGQFFITSQLKNGTYNIEIKKDGFSFFPVTITLNGETVDPLEIRSLE